MTETGIQVGNGSRKRKLKRVLVGVGIVLLVAAAAGGAGVGVRWWQNRGSVDDTHDHTHEEEFSEDVVNAQKLALEDDYDKAHQVINEALNKEGIPAKEKYDLLIQQGITYENQQNYDKALESYRQAESYLETSQVAQYIGYIADMQGNKEMAIAYFKKAISLLPEDDPMTPTTKGYLENRIKALEEGQPQS